MNNDFKAFLQSGDWVDYLNAHDQIAVVNGELFALWALLHVIDDSFTPDSYICRCPLVYAAWSDLLSVLRECVFGDASCSSWGGKSVAFLLGDLEE